MNKGKYSVILLLEFLSQLILFPLCWRIVGDRNFYLAVILTVIVSLGVKLFFVNWFEVKSYHFYIPRKPLYFYYGVSGIVAIFIIPRAFIAGAMAASGGELVFFLVGYTIIWLVPNGIIWLIYLFGSLAYEKKYS
ncbi:hypothetical protein [Candidatus Enterococcus mansonii]|uniref:Uncharacterized protein n=1 Tax=Candidatus Enterococcus mansonii TaxID=1834181 RepID=A0A242C6L6_9ENTE|nr:hypothetical protein [Enterococcus sp. 4G2_DIV0659]OTO05799.1 hypothetical protein A5880_002974 [Enterococcus sp. 4G2_DIV0659]